jgi:hypothetical protein
MRKHLLRWKRLVNQYTSICMARLITVFSISSPGFVGIDLPQPLALQCWMWLTARDAKGYSWTVQLYPLAL